MPERNKLIDLYFELMRLAFNVDLQTIAPEAHQYTFLAAVAFGKAINMTNSERNSGKPDGESQPSI